MTNNKKRMGLSVPICLYKKISDTAGYYGKTLNGLCLEIFWEYFEKQGDKKEVSESDTGKE